MVNVVPSSSILDKNSISNHLFYKISIAYLHKTGNNNIKRLSLQKKKAEEIFEDCKKSNVND